MRKNICVIFIIAALAVSCEKTDFNSHIDEVRNSFNYPEFFTERTSHIVDLYLVYQGAFNPMEYNKEQFKPYVYTITEDGYFDWLYDGFLFLELSGPDGRAIGSAGKDVSKDLYKWLINSHFKEGVGIPALNNLLLDLKEMGLEPTRKRKVIISIPGPLETTTGWGEIGGKILDMTKPEDRIAAVKWFIDETMERWKQEGYTELDFAGFYWLHEGEGAGLSDQYILPEIADYIHSKGLTFYWIPYFSAPMRANWKQYGFDIAYMQPNYFFIEDPGASPGRLDDACQYASKYNMGMEFECNQKLLTDTVYLRRFGEYLDYFQKNSVLETSPVAYYDNRGTLYEMSVSDVEEIKRGYLRITDIIIERQRRADILYKQLTN